MNDQPGATEWGQATCPMTIVEWDYPEDSDVLQPSDPYVCGAELYATWTFSCPLGPGDRIEKADVPRWAVSSSWQVECANGHVLQWSGNLATTADDAEPCVYDVLFKQ